MVVDGFLSYLPARRRGRVVSAFLADRADRGTTVLEVRNAEDAASLHPHPAVPGAAELRRDWSALSPVMRRRFLASDRTTSPRSGPSWPAYARGWPARGPAWPSPAPGWPSPASASPCSGSSRPAPGWSAACCCWPSPVRMAARGVPSGICRAARRRGGRRSVQERGAASIWDLVLPAGRTAAPAEARPPCRRRCAGHTNPGSGAPPATRWSAPCSPSAGTSWPGCAP